MEFGLSTKLEKKQKMKHMKKALDKMPTLMPLKYTHAISTRDHFSFIAKWNLLEEYVEKIHSNPQQNAIEALLLISQKIKNHHELYYSNFNGDKLILKKIYHKDLPRRIAFASRAMAINFSGGQQQNIYRNDISTEMVARIYAKRMQDLHNPKIFPPQTLTYQTIYHVMFKDFIEGISNPDGLNLLKKNTISPNLFS